MIPGTQRSPACWAVSHALLLCLRHVAGKLLEGKVWVQRELNCQSLHLRPARLWCFIRSMGSKIQLCNKQTDFMD